MTCRYLDDLPEGAGEAGGAARGADCPPASPKHWESYFEIKIRWDTIPANQFEGDLASLGAEVPEDAAEQPVNDEFVDIIREESDGKTKKQKSFHLNV